MPAMKRLQLVGSSWLLLVDFMATVHSDVALDQPPSPGSGYSKLELLMSC